MLQSSLYVGLSGQITLQRRLDTVAQNVANSSTAGYRAENVKFGSLISNAGHVPVAYATTQSTTLSRRTGEIVSTGNPLDVAVSGDAWLSIETPAGPAYTRDGRMRMLPTGELQTLTGRPVLDDGGAALTVNPRGGPVEIGRNGVIQQSGRQVGRIGLFTIDKAAALKRFDDAAVIPDRAADPVTDFNIAGVVQGYIERANVNPVLEMSNLINVSRAFDAISTAMSDTEDTLRRSIDTLGAPSR